MTFIQWYAFVILPILVASLGWIVVLIHGWHMRRKHPERRQHG